MELALFMKEVWPNHLAVFSWFTLALYMGLRTFLWSKDDANFLADISLRSNKSATKEMLGKALLGS